MATWEDLPDDWRWEGVMWQTALGRYTRLWYYTVEHEWEDSGGRAWLDVVITRVSTREMMQRRFSRDAVAVLWMSGMLTRIERE